MVIIDFSKNWVIQNFVDNKVIHSLNFIASKLKIITNKLDFINQLNNLLASYFEISAYSVWSKEINSHLLECFHQKYQAYLILKIYWLNFIYLVVKTNYLNSLFDFQFIKFFWLLNSLRFNLMNHFLLFIFKEDFDKIIIFSFLNVVYVWPMLIQNFQTYLLFLFMITKFILRK